MKGGKHIICRYKSPTSSLSMDPSLCIVLVDDSTEQIEIIDFTFSIVLAIIMQSADKAESLKK